jgi:hypothetical protein
MVLTFNHRIAGRRTSVMTTLDRQPITQPSTSPTTKVAAGGFAGAVTIVVVYILGHLDVTVPAEVGSALTVIFTSLTSYFVKERAATGASPTAATET